MLSVWFGWENKVNTALGRSKCWGRDRLESQGRGRKWGHRNGGVGYKMEAMEVWGLPEGMQESGLKKTIRLQSCDKLVDGWL